MRTSFIASGNIIFETPALDSKLLEEKIQAKLQTDLGYDVATFIRTDQEVNSIAAYEPFSPTVMKASVALNIAFLKDPLDQLSIQKLMALKSNIDDFHIHEREIYWLCLKKQSESTFSNALLEKTLGKQSTLRGIKTIKSLAAIYPAN
jgi:uncharacterized protein (DUF1697 family)